MFNIFFKEVKEVFDLSQRRVEGFLKHMLKSFIKYYFPNFEKVKFKETSNYRFLKG